MDVFYYNKQYLSIYERLVKAGHSAKLYYFDAGKLHHGGGQPAPESAEIIRHVRSVSERLQSSASFRSTVLSNRIIPTTKTAGESRSLPISTPITTYSRVRSSSPASITRSARTRPLEDHRAADRLRRTRRHLRSCASAALPEGWLPGDARQTGVPGLTFEFDRLGVRVPAVLFSPWITKGSVVPGPEDAVNGRIFEHASIPATATEFFLGNYSERSPREQQAQTFLDLLTDTMRPEEDCPIFDV